MLAANEYLESQVTSASPYRLHLMVIDGAIRFARKGLTAVEGENWDQMHLSLNKSRDFVMEIISGLNPVGDPELVERMKSVFLFAYRRLAFADLERNPQHVRDALRILELHRETWVELGEKLSAQSTTLQGPHTQNWA